MHIHSKKEIKILVDAHVFDDDYQGTRTYLKGLYNGLINCQFSFVFYFVARNVEKLKSEFTNCPNVHFLSLRSKNKFIRLIFELPFICKKYKIDYAHYQYISPLIKSCKEIVTIHDLLFKEYPQYFPKTYIWKNSYLFKHSALRADLLLTVSEYSKKSICRFYPINASKIFITPNAVSEKLIQCKYNFVDIKQKYNIDKYILYVSRFEPRKNHLGLLQAFTELNLSDLGYKLLFIGRTDIECHKYISYLKTLSPAIKQNIITLDNIDEDELIAFYQCCSLFVYPSFAEGFGIPPLEATIVGAPVICSNATAMSDYHFFNNVFFNPYEVEDIKAKIMTNLNKQNTIPKETIISKYNWEAIAKDFGEIILNHYNCK